MNKLNNNYQKKFICLLDQKFIEQIYKYFEYFKTNNVNEIFICLSNHQESWMFFYLEQRTVNTRIFLSNISFLNINEEINLFVGKQIYNSTNTNFQNEIIIEKLDYYFYFSVIDSMNFIKCFDKQNTDSIVFFDFEKNEIRVSNLSSIASILLSETSKYVSESIEKHNSLYEVTNENTFCYVKDLINLFEYSYIVCSNAYGRIVNKATGFIYLDGYYYCVNTNGRILVIKKINTQFKTSFNINIPKNISKFFIEFDKNEIVTVFVNENTCYFKCKNIHIEFQLVDQKHYINTLIMHEFHESIELNSEIFNNIFMFFNKVKGLTAESSIVLCKEKNDLNIFCIIKDEKNTIKSKIGIIASLYIDKVLNIKLGFDIFNLIKLVIKKLSNDKNSVYSFSYDYETSASFANISLEKDGISLFFAIR